MTEESTATEATGLADGFTPLNPPTHLRIDFVLTGTPVAGHVVMPIDWDMEFDDLWLQDPSWNYALADDPEDPKRFVRPFTYDRDEPGFISQDMAEKFFDAVKSAADAVHRAFEWDYLDSGDVWTFAWMRDDVSLQLDHQYGDEHALRLDDARFEVEWRWGGADLVEDAPEALPANVRVWHATTTDGPLGQVIVEAWVHSPADPGSYGRLDVRIAGVASDQAGHTFAVGKAFEITGYDVTAVNDRGMHSLGWHFTVTEAVKTGE